MARFASAARTGSFCPTCRRLRVCPPIPWKRCARHEAAGLHVHPRTATPSWLGERLDVGYAIDVLHPLAPGVCRRIHVPPARADDCILPGALTRNPPAA
jgi:hypothetical protein